MPYVLSPPVTTTRAGVWGEGPAYEVANLYRIEDPDPPPVHYDQHLLRPHSITHAEAPGHVVAGGATLDDAFARVTPFWGPALVVRLPARSGSPARPPPEAHPGHDSGRDPEHDPGREPDPDPGHAAERIHEVTAEELAPHLEGHDEIAKVLVTAEHAEVDDDGHHAADDVFVLSPAAARLLVQRPHLDLFGTSWRSSDHRPGSPQRPVHRILFERAVVLEYLDLRGVPAGRYFLAAFPVRLAGATESPLTPVLFRADELSDGLVAIVDNST